MALTFADLKSGTTKRIAGVCVGSQDFLDYTNKAVRQIMRRGDWIGSVVPIFVCAMRGCVVFPRYVGQVRKLNVCRHPTPIASMWYQYFQHNHRHDCGGWGHWLGHERMLIQNGETPVAQDIMGDGRLVRAYPSVQADVGKTITIFGVDNNGQVLRTQNPDNSWSDGIVLTLAIPFASTAVFVRRIDRVLKDVTQGDVRLYGYNAAANVLEDIVLYRPGETNPSFQRYQLHTHCLNIQNNSATPGTCGQPQSVMALVKLKFIPVAVDSDMIPLDNVDAVELMIQSIRHREAGDRSGAQASEADCIRELNAELSDTITEDVLAATTDFGEVGRTDIGFQKCF